jgi:hypothetical protein
MCRGFLQPCLKYLPFFTLCLLAFTVPFIAAAQVQGIRGKLSPELARDVQTGRAGENSQVRVFVLKGSLSDSLELAPYTPRIILSSGAYTVMQMEISAGDLLREILPMKNVVFIEKIRKPVPELFVGSMDLSLNGIRLAQEKFQDMKGDGRVASVKEDEPDSTDLDIVGRILPSAFASGRVNGHATLMSTIIAGAGNSWHLGRGVAPAAEISPADFSTLLPEPDAYYQSGDIAVQNHSYGVGIESFYGADAAMYDASAISVPGLLHVFSAGNRGNAAPPTGPYQGLAGFANLTGSFKMSKNSLSVGALDSFIQAEPLSSRGPAHDGRVKPELMAFGEDGSSGAAALVSGTALLLQADYRQLRGAEMPNALARAILINSADDLGEPAVDHIHGFGNLNAYQAMLAIREGRYHSGTIQPFSERVTELTVPGGMQQLKITLAWNDPPAIPNAAKALVHDLNLLVRNTATGETWLPWVLSTFPQADSLRRQAIRGRDSLNNVEQVTIDLPGSGVYEIRVSAEDLTNVQEYHLTWQQDTADFFEWLYPLATDPVEAGRENLLRWKTNIRSQAASLEYSRDYGNSWILVRNGVDLETAFYRWPSPPGMGPVMLRITNGSRAYQTDTVVLSTLPEPVFGFSCPDSFYLHWNPFPGALSYRLFAMGPRYLVQTLETNDTMAVLANKSYPGNYVAMEPVLSGLAGQRSYTYNHTTQGAGCYIRSFRGELHDGEALLYLSLGTQFQVQRIFLEKWNGSDFLALDERAASDSLEYVFKDSRIINGINRYRVRVEISGGRNVFSLPEDLFYTGTDGYRLYPNLVRRGQSMQLAVENIADDATFQVFDMQGRLLFQDFIRSSPQEIQTTKLVPGVYIIRVLQNGGKAWIGKCTVL